MARTIPELSVESQEIERMLAAAKVGDLVTYKAITAHIRNDVQKLGRCYLNTARKMQLRDGRVWECVRTKGLKLLQSSEIVQSSDHGIKKIRREAHRSKRRLEAADYDAISDVEKDSMNARLTVFHFFERLTRPAKISLIEVAAAKVHRRLFLPETADAFDIKGNDDTDKHNEEEDYETKKK